MAPIVYTVREACEASKTSRSSLYEAMRRGELRAKKRGKRTLIEVDALQSWISGLPPKPCSIAA